MLRFSNKGITKLKIPEILKQANEEITWVSLLSGIVAEVAYSNDITEAISNNKMPQLLDEIRDRLIEVLNLEFDEEQVANILRNEQRNI